jgi:uncharacterized protein YbjT (DUF2867 family)
MARILVTRATGRVGSEVVRRLRERGVEVKAGTTEPERAAALFDAGVEIVELDYRRTETYDAAVMWADRIFLVPPPFEPRADEDLIPFLDWAVAAGTEHVVLLSAMGLEERDTVPLRRVEQRVVATGVPFTFLRPNWYMQNFVAGFLAAPVRERGVLSVAAGDAAVSFVDVRDVAEAAAAVLCGDVHAGRAYTLTGPEALTHHDAARVLSHAAGREIRYEPVSDDDMRRVLLHAGWPAGRVEVAMGLFRAMRAGERSPITGDLAALTGREPVSFTTFAAEHADALATR